MDYSENRRILKGRRRSKNIVKTHPNLKKSTAQCRLHEGESEYVSSSHTTFSKDNLLNRSETVSNRIRTNSSNVSTFSGDDKSTNDTLTSNLNATKFSANNRLKNYRVCLNERRNEMVRVHQVLNKPSNLTHSLCLNKKESSLLGKRALPNETDRTKQSIDHELQDKKRKIIKEREIVKTTTDSNIEPSMSNDTIEMDWSPINETEIISNIQKFRVNHRDKLHLVPEACSLILSNDTSCETSKNNILYMVIDTNIFISHLHLIQNILSEEHVADDHIIYIPWIVVQELDYFKDGRSGSPLMLKTATRAIKFINENLMKKHRRLIGQTVQEALSQKESVSNADDNILFCCLKLAETSKNVILLSNDTNLRNKALINNITAYGPKNVLEKMNKIKKDDESKLKVNQINAVLANTCTEIILAEMKEAYGSVLFNLISKPPWDFKQCLVYIKRFWIPVFSLVIAQKQCLKVIEDLLVFVQTYTDLTTEENMEKFIKLCLSLCVYFKNCLPKYHKIVKTCIDDIQKSLS